MALALGRYQRCWVNLGAELAQTWLRHNVPAKCWTVYLTMLRTALTGRGGYGYLQAVPWIAYTVRVLVIASYLVPPSTYLMSSISFSHFLVLRLDSATTNERQPVLLAVRAAICRKLEQPNTLPHAGTSKLHHPLCSQNL